MRTQLTVAEYITLLQALPPDTQVYFSWEGELLHPHPPELVTVHRWKHEEPSAKTHYSIDYYPELEPDEDYVRSAGVVLS